MKLELTLGSDTPKPSLVGPLIKLAVLGVVALVVVNRKDIRRYVRLRQM